MRVRLIFASGGFTLSTSTEVGTSLSYDIFKFVGHVGKWWGKITGEGLPDIFRHQLVNKLVVSSPNHDIIA